MSLERDGQFCAQNELEGSPKRANKKAKLLLTPESSNKINDKPEVLSHAEKQKLVASVCEQYRVYLDSTEEDDLHELEALYHLLQRAPESMMKPFDMALATIESVADMFPILASVVYSQLASCTMSRFLHLLSNTNEGGGEQGNDQILLGSQLGKAQKWIDLSLVYFPRNAATWSMGANLGRITFTLAPESKIVQWYEQAAAHANRVRRETIYLLETKDYNDDDENFVVKEWMELLLLHQVAGVEYTADEITDDDNDEEKEEEDGYFGPSSVEGTSRFMASILLSRTGEHQRAMAHLQKFSLTHRLHPNVWGHSQKGEQNEVAPKTRTPIAPVSFQDDVLPPRLLQRISQVFAPDAVYWKESDYANRGFYSFLTNIEGYGGDDSNSQRPPNLIHDVVINHLLPLAKQVLGKNDATASQICAYEWWVHSREAQANLGHTLHFDTDEASLKSDQEVHHPLLSSVLYVTGDETSGATVILDQTPSCDSVTDMCCWRSVPKANTFMVFPGNLLHGVLPCPGIAETSSDGVSDTKRATSKLDPNSRKSEWAKRNPSESSQRQRRLTFMVGFKTRQVPDQRVDMQDMYGPCAPLPPSSENWVREIEHGYKTSTEDSSASSLLREETQDAIKMQHLPSVLPAWESIVSEEVEDGELPLEVPHSIDHRFFVKGAPHCFRESLFDHDDVP